MSERAKATEKTPKGKKENSVSKAKRTNSSLSKKSPLDKIMFLQRTVGNHAVEKLLKSGVIHGKLTIGQLGDIYEQEADRVADQVMRMPHPHTTEKTLVSGQAQFPYIQRMCAECEENLHRQTPGIQIQRVCSECEEELQRQPMEAEEEEELIQTKPTFSQITSLVQRQVEPEEEGEETLQTKEVSGSTPEVSSETESRINSIRGGGQPLPESVRAFFEPRFSRDFSHVRIHTDSPANESAKSVNALAYTVGTDIVFGAGQYAPETAVGKKLLAHELIHVVQQDRSLPREVPQQLMIQRQISIPVFDELDICIIVPPGLPPPFDKAAGKQLCGSHAKALCEKIPSIPGCGIFKKKGKKEEKKVICPPGFKTGMTKDFQGQCCKEGVTAENAADCCPPERIAIKATDPRCCPKGTEPDNEKKTCVTPTPFILDPCPPDQPALLSTCLCFPPERQNFLKGICCPEGEVGTSGECVVKEKPKPPPPKPPPFSTVKTIEIEFKKDAPQTWYDPRSSFSVSVTNEGKAHFQELVTTMKRQPELLVQLEGRASSDKPPGDADYNRRLTDRRVRLIADELKKKDIDPSTRVANPPGQTNPSGCEEIDTGLLSCGDTGAKVPVGPKDRKVVARVFSLATQVTP